MVLTRTKTPSSVNKKELKMVTELETENPKQFSKKRRKSVWYFTREVQTAMKRNLTCLKNGYILETGKVLCFVVHNIAESVLG